jgi:hypothetical protein
MAKISTETWVSDDNSIAAVKKQGGGYIYFVNTGLMLNGKEVADYPFIARRIANASFEVMEAKQNERSRLH